MRSKRTPVRHHCMVVYAPYPLGETRVQREAEALEKARHSPPGLVISDLLMPVMDGWEFRTVQLDDPELLKIPTVVYTAVGNVRERERSGAYRRGWQRSEIWWLAA